MSASFGKAYEGRRVLVTGHTGFKGSWLCHWLLNLGATVRGYALAPPSTPALFDALHLSERIQDVRADIRNPAQIQGQIRDFQPDFVFHLAAQPLVRYSYQQPWKPTKPTCWAPYTYWTLCGDGTNLVQYSL